MPTAIGAFLCSAEAPFLCPGLIVRMAPRAAAVRNGRRPPRASAARSVLDGGKHGARLGGTGRARDRGYRNAATFACITYLLEAPIEALLNIIQST